MIQFALTVLCSAFLLFQVQPLIARFILPWFGGGPAIWTTCMLFFQVLLLVGYSYAHWLSARPQRQQLIIHGMLLVAACLFLPIGPDESWKPADSAEPVTRILLLLSATIGLPYTLLSTTGPLIQHWFGQVYPGRSPYRLFALSNAGSLLALLSYPLFFEPNLLLETQVFAWSLGFGVFAVLCAVCAWHANRSAVTGPQERAMTDLPSAAHPEVDQATTADSKQTARPNWVSVLRWLLLSTSPSVLLLATTNQLCQEVAVVPFLWVLPLTLYLLSFILCFDSDRWYHRGTFLTLLIVTSPLAVLCIAKGVLVALPLQLLIFGATLFVCCMTCHGELARSRPQPEYLTLFYLAVSAGGALGGVLVVLVAPAVTTRLVEYHAGLILSVAATLMAYFTARDWKLYRGRPLWAWGLLVALFASETGALIYETRSNESGLLERSRNFYGVLTVSTRRDELGEYRTIRHGRIQHGLQYTDEELQLLKTSYYGPQSGVGIAIEQHPRRSAGQPMHVGVIGLGTGTLAAYGREGDRVRYYEINPDVIRLARKYFTYLERSLAEVDVVMGDARVMLEQELSAGERQQFDVLAVDAFSSDAIPMHLLTREAMEIYWEHLRDDGVLAVHISNRYLDLKPIVWNLSEDLGLVASRIEFSPDDDNPAENTSTWVLVTRNADWIDQPQLRDLLTGWDDDMPETLWTDDFGSLWQVVKTPSLKDALSKLFEWD